MAIFIKSDALLERERAEQLEERWSRIANEPCILLPAGMDVVRPDVLYECDRRACKSCHDECSYTHDIRHARNFKVDEFGGFVEVK